MSVNRQENQQRTGVVLGRILGWFRGPAEEDGLSLDSAVYDRWRRTLLLAIPFGILAFAVGAWLDVPSGQSIPYDRVGYPVMAILLGVLEVVLWLRRGSLRLVVTGIVLGASTFFLAKLLVLLSGGLDPVAIQRQMTETFFWIPVIYLLSFLVPGVAGGRVVSTGFTLAVLVVSAWYAALRGPQPGHLGVIYALGEMNLANSVQLALTFAFIGLKETFLLNQFERQSAERFAQTDLLTGLPNRRVLEEVFADRAARVPGDALAAMFLDIDGFKAVNDTLGHEAGDRLLQRFAERVRAVVRDDDLVVRLSGDEFVVVAPGIRGRPEAGDLADRIFAALSAPFVVDGAEVSVTASIGVAFYPEDAADATAVLRHADSAMYKVKRSGKNGLRFYSPESDAPVERKGQVERELKSALRNRELSLYYQPIVALDGGRVVRVEALLRWHHPRLGEVSPEEFVPIAEESGSIVEIGHWVLAEACRQLRSWRDQGLSDLCLSVNVSPLEFSQPGFVGTIQGALECHGLPADAIQLELTESVIVNRVEEVLATLVRLRRLGIAIALDDFGTGYSSLAYLRDLPIDAVKIDRTFVRDLARPREAPQFAMALVEAILSLAGHLDLVVIAEGVESEAQRQLLVDFGCHQAQGYLFARPLPPDRLQRWMWPAPGSRPEMTQERLIN